MAGGIPDKQTARLLAEMHVVEGPPVRNMPLRDARAAYEHMMIEYWGETDPVQKIDDVSISGRGGEIVSRIYHPGDSTRPLIVFLHGGGWTLGNIASYDGLARAICGSTGCAVLIPEFRLSPEHTYPAALHDTLDTVKFAAIASDELGIHKDQIWIAGDSAGGNLAAAACCALQSSNDLALAGQLLFYPMLDVRHKPPYLSRQQFGDGGFFLTNEDIQWATENYLSDSGQADDPLVSPMATVLDRALPRTLIITAECDPLRDEGQAYANVLQESGTEVSELCVDGAIHGFLSFNRDLPSSDFALRKIAEFIRSAN